MNVNGTLPDLGIRVGSEGRAQASGSSLEGCWRVCLEDQEGCPRRGFKEEEGAGWVREDRENCMRKGPETGTL